MRILKRFVSACRRTFFEQVANRRAPIRLSPSVISLCFDDVPKSAVTNGLPILTQEGVRASFYVALEYQDDSPQHASGDGGPSDFIAGEEVRLLHRAGHHIGCHTLSHFDISSGSAEALVLDCNKSRVELSRLLDGEPIEHFAYPRGAVTVAAKEALGKDYKTLRGVYGGINSGSIDLTMLRANRIYSDTLDLEALADLVRQNEERSGWLILYTHGVQENPDAWSTSPGDLLKVVRLCKASSCRILTVREAYEALAV